MTEGGRGSRGQVETQQRVWERTKVSNYLCTSVYNCVFVSTCVLLLMYMYECVHLHWLAWYELPTNDMFVCVPRGLLRRKGQDVWAEAKTRCAGGGEVVDLLVLCTLDGGGDGRSSVRPVALLWRVTSSPGPWHCGSSTKPCRGQREKTTHECGGGSGCESGCRCEWACITERGRKTGRERERESNEF